MQDFSENRPESEQYQPRPHRRSHALIWCLVGFGLLVLLSCGGLFGWAVWIGLHGPETHVYTGNQLPGAYIETIKDVGALNDNEKILYFYSDALLDIRDGFCFVSNQKLVLYSETSGTDPLTVISFQDIKELDIVRDDSFWFDSQITVFLTDGVPVSFPVSSELERDMKFFKAIESRVPTQEADP
jgi:hypothetical protein